jgi:hypothetical protein
MSVPPSGRMKHVRKSGHEMAIRDLRSLSLALEPKMSASPPKADIDDGVELSAEGRLC